MKTRLMIACTVFAIGLAGLIPGCSSGNDHGGSRGSLAIALGATGVPSAGTLPKLAATEAHDDALSGLQSAVMTIAGVEARSADGAWLPIETGLPVEVDAVGVMDPGRAATLPADVLPQGDYDALELRITRIQLTLLDTAKVVLAPPGTGWTVLVPVSFSIAADEGTTVNLKLRCANSFRLFDGEYGFDPDFEVVGVERD
jgi:hypothetical protein